LTFHTPPLLKKGGSVGAGHRRRQIRVWLGGRIPEVSLAVKIDFQLVVLIALA
jgi:hypothetical protein